MPRRGLTLVELLVVIGIVSVLVALAVPAIQRVRESANRVVCESKMRQLALACHLFHNDRHRLPYSQLGDEQLPYDPMLNPWWGPASKSWSFLAKLLPYLEQGPLVKEGAVFHQTLRDSGICATKLPFLLCPSDPSATGPPRLDAGNLEGFAVGHTSYKGVSGANWGYDQTQDLWFPTPYRNQGTNGSFDGKMEGDGLLCRNDHHRKPTLGRAFDGLSCTFLLGEDVPVRNWWLSWPYANNAHGTCAIPPNSTPPRPGVWYYSWSFRSRHPGGLNFAFADASVRWVSNSIELDVYRALATAHGRETITFGD